MTSQFPHHNSHRGGYRVTDKIKRRGFVGLCAGTMAWLSNARWSHANNTAFKKYERVQLIGHDDKPLEAKNLSTDQSLIFNYPYVSTPCFLLNLGMPLTKVVNLKTDAGTGYAWRGGVGGAASIVAFAAICAHKLSHPAKQISFINYRAQPVGFYDRDDKNAERGQVIYCCSEKSVYDPARGAEVLGGPATQPLSTVILEVDKADHIYALGTLGGELYEKYFEKFGFRLALESGSQDIKALTVDKVRAIPIEQYSKRQMLCG